MSVRREVPGGLISSNDAARLIVRGALIVAPKEMREQYSDFVKPLSMGKEDYGDEESVSPALQALFEEFVKSLSKLQLEKPSPTLVEITAQVKGVLIKAKEFIEILKNHQLMTKDESTGIILNQIVTITENVGLRTVVLNYPTPASSGGLYGSADTEWRSKSRSFKDEKLSVTPIKSKAGAPVEGKSTPPKQLGEEKKRRESSATHFSGDTKKDNQPIYPRDYGDAPHTESEATPLHPKGRDYGTAKKQGRGG